MALVIWKDTPNSSFITETIEDKIPVWLICHPGVVRETLTTLLSAADFVVKDPGEDQPFAVILVRLDGHEKIAPLPQEVPLYEVGFRASASTKTLGAVSLNYAQVFANTTPALSSLDELTRRIVFDDKTQVRGGECAPMVLEDACQHVVQTVLSGKREGGSFSSEKKVSYSEFLLGLRSQLEVPQGKRVNQVRLPPMGTVTIPARDTTAVINEIASYYETFRPVSMEKARDGAKKRGTKRRLKVFFLSASFMAGVLVTGGYVWYHLAARGLSDQVRALAFEAQSASVSPGASEKISQLNILGSLADFFFSWVRAGKISDLRLSLPLISAIIDSTQEVKQAKQDLLSAFETMVAQKKEDTADLLKAADAHLDTAYKNFSLVQARFVQQEVSLPPILGGKAVQEQLAANLPQVRHDILGLRSFIGASTILLQGKHAYALLLLDHTNLRGSGGTVASVAVVTIDQGKLLTYQVYPVSVINQMFTGQAQAPDEFKAYMRESVWTLSDATWELPFSKSAERLTWFLGKELARPIDGVVTLPTRSLPALLAALGPVNLVDEGELSGENFSAKQEEIIARLAQDPSGLETWENKIFSAVLEKLIHADKETLAKAAGVFLNQLNSSEINLGVSDKEAGAMFAALSWDGGITSPACPSAFNEGTCRVSTMLEMEENLGQNKTNAFITRSHVHAIKVGSEVLLHNRILTLTNHTSLLAWPYGSYQGLVKFVINADALVQSVSVNDQGLTPGQFSLVKSDGKLTVRLGVEVAPLATVRVKLLYTQPGIPAENSSLVFFEQKQPGAGNDPFTLMITYPDNYTPKSLAPRAEVGKNTLTFTSSHDSNRLFAVGF